MWIPYIEFHWIRCSGFSVDSTLSIVFDRTCNLVQVYILQHPCDFSSVELYDVCVYTLCVQCTQNTVRIQLPNVRTVHTTNCGTARHLQPYRLARLCRPSRVCRSYRLCRLAKDCSATSVGVTVQKEQIQLKFELI